MPQQKRQRSVSLMAATAQDHLDVGGGRLAWLSSLDTAYSPQHNYRRSSIICTIGPKTNSVEAICRDTEGATPELSP
ncbi:hypothetical protein NLG97_g2751 [Lecanicillium saksenae]|uniref:Uncharacterized protein n=1 Tax=Lecanicillium saksenae TaxID=468837 RepID=A0ACC1R3A8_9HYPO|nr:hypothetical protein NLG97_g2751 [Lecanicillium saksenae]